MSPWETMRERLNPDVTQGSEAGDGPIGDASRTRNLDVFDVQSGRGNGDGSSFRLADPELGRDPSAEQAGRESLLERPSGLGELSGQEGISTIMRLNRDEGEAVVVNKEDDVSVEDSYVTDDGVLVTEYSDGTSDSSAPVEDGVVRWKTNADGNRVGHAVLHSDGETRIIGGSEYGDLFLGYTDEEQAEAYTSMENEIDHDKAEAFRRFMEETS